MFLSNVAERANVPEDDAEDLTRDFLQVLAKVLDRGSWEMIQEIVPLQVDHQSGGGQQSLTMEEFLVELSGEERVEDEQAAIHARAVAGAIRDAASRSQMDELSSLIEDDTTLALFEDRRGELTSVPNPSDGEVAQHTRPKAADREQSPPTEGSDDTG